jgi:hypothetical protein
MGRTIGGRRGQLGGAASLGWSAVPLFAVVAGIENTFASAKLISTGPCVHIRQRVPITLAIGWRLLGEDRLLVTRLCG